MKFAVFFKYLVASWTLDDPQTLEEFMNFQGAVGWEIFQVIPITGGGVVLYGKRAIVHDERGVKIS